MRRLLALGAVVYVARVLWLFHEAASNAERLMAWAEAEFGTRSEASS